MASSILAGIGFWFGLNYCPPGQSRVNGACQDGSAWIDDNENRYFLRGGSWFYQPVLCRCADRIHDYRDDDIGLRVVCVRPSTLCL